MNKRIDISIDIYDQPHHIAKKCRKTVSDSLPELSKKETDIIPVNDLNQESMIDLDDSMDAIRNWGVTLFQTTSNVFEDGEYREKYNMLYNSFQSPKTLANLHFKSSLYDDYIATWKEFFPENSRPLSFTLTGSDTGTVIHSLTYQHAQLRTSKKSSIKRGYPIFFCQVYGAGRGEYSGINHIPSIGGTFAHPPDDKYIIQYNYANSISDDNENEKRIINNESMCLNKIKALLRDNTAEVGSIWIETIVGHTRHVQFMRPLFLQKLRLLADQFRVPIICDEILTCGGRTGKPLAYQHFRDFQPDYFLFGKGLIAAGVAVVDRIGVHTCEADYTSIQWMPHILLASMQVMKFLLRNNICQKVEENGKILLELIKSHDKHATGIGMMINTIADTNTTKGAGFRLLLALDLSKDYVQNHIIHNKTLPRQHRSVCSLCGEKNLMDDIKCSNCATSYHKICEERLDHTKGKGENFLCDECTIVITRRKAPTQDLVNINS